MMGMSPQPEPWREPYEPLKGWEPMEPAGTKVRFTARFRSVELEQADFPIEVRTLSAALVKQGVLSGVLSLNPGSYIAIAHLPGGQDAQAEFYVSGDEPNLRIELQLDPSDESPNESQEVQRFVRGAGETPLVRRERVSSRKRLAEKAIQTAVIKPWFIVTKDLRLAPAASHRIAVCGFTGNLLKGEIKAVQGRGWLERCRETKPPGFSEFVVTDPSIIGIQILRTDRRALNLLVPSGRNAPNEPPARIAIRTLHDGYVAQAHPGDLLADSLLKYAEEGMADAMTLLSRAHAERLLADKIERPIAAAVGAYSLLRTGAVEALHDWTRNLYNWMAWLPDAVPILAEHLARQGKHAEALEILVNLPERGLPIFTDGFSYMLDRLRLYVRSNESKFEEHQVKEGQALLDRLEDFSVAVDFSQPAVSFAGIDPSGRGDWTFNFSPLEAIDITDELVPPASRSEASQASEVVRHGMEENA